MILVLGSSADDVYPYLIARLGESGHPYRIVDEDHPGNYNVSCEISEECRVFRIHGDGCDGTNPVASIFVRHAVARTLEIGHLNLLGKLQACLNGMLLHARCPTVNQPANTFSNYSKPYQVGLLAEAGFDVPRSLVTNFPKAARRFYDECKGAVIFKGVSNVMTLAQVLGAEEFDRLELLPNSPTLFQEYVPGVDYRVHVIGDDAFVTRLTAENVDYRRSSLMQGEDIAVESAQLPQQTVEKCIAFTKQLGLVVSGIDFKQSLSGRLVALELNPYPQFTFYEKRSGQPITKAIVNYLIKNQISDTNVFA